MNFNNNLNNNFISFINQTQKDIVLDESRIILINGCAGSRKTDTLIKKGINYLISKKNIIFLTFVSSVSNEIKKRMEQTLKIEIPKIGLSNHFLSCFDTNFIEIANIDAWIHKQINWIEKNIIEKKINNKQNDDFDNYVKNKLDLLREKKSPIDFNSRVKLLKNYIDIYKFYNIVLKNDCFADVILIDEFQDTDIDKVELIIMLIKNNQNLFCIVAGDILQTIFFNNIGCKNFINPINYFKNKLEPKYYEINTCFRCPAPHINFVNYLLGDKYKKYGLNLIIPQNNDILNKPVLFCHDCISKNDTSYKLALSISKTIIKILKYDNSIKPDDIAIMMKKSNSNYVFEHIKNILPKLYKKNLILEKKDFYTQLIHFETSGDGYSNSINWDKAKNKTVLISIHGDKGKGHKVVFFLGLSKKSIPSDYNIGKDFELVDISLLNVALTRSLKYLFIGFTYASPSIYLSTKHEKLENYCYLAWDENIKDKLKGQDKQIYMDSINELNKYLSNRNKSKKNIPYFSKNIINENDFLTQTSKLPIKLNINVSQDIAKDMVGFLDDIVENLVREEDCIDFYDSINLNEIPEPFYKIFGFVGELCLMRLNMIKTKNFGIFGWILNSTIYYTDSDHFLNIIYDYKLNHYINDYSLWNDKVIEIEFESIISNNKHKIIDLVNDLYMQKKTKFIINKFYEKYNIEKCIKDFCSDITNSLLFENKIENIIIISLIYAEFNCEIRRDFMYDIVDSIINLKSIKKIINQIILNSQYVWEHIFEGNKNNINFQKNISIENKIKNKNILKYYGFDQKYDKNVYSKGLKLTIGGICDIIVDSNNNHKNDYDLYEIKTCLKTSFSNEWVVQIIVYNELLKIVDNIHIRYNYIINLFDGTIYKIKFDSNNNILKKILKLYDFDDFLTNLLLN